MNFKNLRHNQQGIAAIEFAMFVPLLLTMLLGIVDVGNGLLAHKKVVSSAQIIADLIGREVTASTSELDDAYMAAKMAMEPLPTDVFGVDIASIQFVGTNLTPTVRWRQTYNATPNTQAATLATGLGLENDGVLVITTHYRFTPLFTRFFLHPIDMQEVAIIRGRRVSFIGRG